MAIKNVLIEIRKGSTLENVLAGQRFGQGVGPEAAAAAGPGVPGLTIDPLFPAVPLPVTRREERAATSEAGLVIPEPEAEAIFVRGTIDEDVATPETFGGETAGDVVAIYADPVIEPSLTCLNSDPQGNATDVARLLDVRALSRASMDGRGVLLAIVDTGINLAHLRSKGLNPNINVARSWVPTLTTPGAPTLVPFELPVGHGTMCAFDALIAAPKATLLDIAALQSRRVGATSMDGLLSDAVLAYSFLVRVIREMQRPGDFRSLVVSNSWCMFRRTWDFPPGHPGNYSDNPAHPFNLIVGTLERAGADILFAAGNCGSECPDGRCGNEQNPEIYGANSHPAVLSVAGVDIRKNRVGYSNRGPGRLERKKPDICGYTHFDGSGVYPADGGTSAATPVVAGVVAAFRSKFPSGPNRPPAALRDLVRQTAESRNNAGFNEELGFGVVSGRRLSQSSLPPGGPEALPSGGVRQESRESEEEFLAALGAFEAGTAERVSATESSRLWQAGAGEIGAAAAVGQLCDVYRRVNPILTGILGFIQRIPRVGGPAAAAVQRLMEILDGVCAEEARITGGTGGTAGLTNLMAMSRLNQLCREYQLIHPILDGILRAIEHIPIIGSRAARAIRALMSAIDVVCDAVCPTVAAESSSSEDQEFMGALASFER